MKALATVFFYAGLSAVSARLTTWRTGYRVQRFDRWNDALDQALAALPEHRLCPHALYREMATTPSKARRRFFIIRHQDEVVAVIGCRQHDPVYDRWTTLGEFQIPGFIFPHQPGHDLVALGRATGCLRQLVIWPINNTVAIDDAPRERQRSYVFDLRNNLEAFWKKTGHLKTVLRARRKCKNMTLKVNAPGALEWMFENWEKSWRTPFHGDAEERICVGRALEQSGRHVTLSLWDGDRLVVANSFVIDGDTAYSLITHRDRSYVCSFVGTHLTDRAYHWMQAAGVRYYDMMPGFDYKARWAPLSHREYTTACLRPGIMRYAKALATGWRRTGAQTDYGFHGPPSTVQPIEPRVITPAHTDAPQTRVLAPVGGR